MEGLSKDLKDKILQKIMKRCNSRGNLQQNQNQTNKSINDSSFNRVQKWNQTKMSKYLAKNIPQQLQHRYNSGIKRESQQQQQQNQTQLLQQKQKQQQQGNNVNEFLKRGKKSGQKSIQLKNLLNINFSNGQKQRQQQYININQNNSRYQTSTKNYTEMNIINDINNTKLESDSYDKNNNQQQDYLCYSHVIDFKKDNKLINNNTNTQQQQNQIQNQYQSPLKQRLNQFKKSQQQEQEQLYNFKQKQVRNLNKNQEIGKKNNQDDAIKIIENLNNTPYQKSKNNEEIAKNRRMGFQKEQQRSFNLSPISYKKTIHLPTRRRSQMQKQQDNINSLNTSQDSVQKQQQRQNIIQNINVQFRNRYYIMKQNQKKKQENEQYQKDYFQINNLSSQSPLTKRRYDIIEQYKEHIQNKRQQKSDQQLLFSQKEKREMDDSITIKKVLQLDDLFDENRFRIDLMEGIQNQKNHLKNNNNVLVTYKNREEQQKQQQQFSPLKYYGKDTIDYEAYNPDEGRVNTCKDSSSRRRQQKLRRRQLSSNMGSFLQFCKSDDVLFKQMDGNNNFANIISDLSDQGSGDEFGIQDYCKQQLKTEVY